MKTVFVVLCDQSYAAFTCVIGVFTTREKAEACVDEDSDRVIEEYTLDENTFEPKT